MSTRTQFSTDDRFYQKTVLKKYRDKGLIPSLQKVALEAGVSVSTAAMFMYGNSQNANIISVLTRHIERETSSVPADLATLIGLWKKI